MADAKLLISRLKGTQPAPQIICDEQSTSDIIRQILVKHRQCAADYDLICDQFEGETLYECCENLYNFCRKNFNYVIEDEEMQYTSSPLTMLKHGKVDCKNYSLFCAGCLDALKRRGWKFNWCFRFASYNIFKPRVGHVFVVVNPASDDIWVDPVIDEFNAHEFYWYHKDRRVSGAKVGAIGKVAAPARIGSAENDLLNQLYQYWQGLVGAVKLTNATGQLNSISMAILSSASLAVPGIGEALAAYKAGQVVLNNTFGAGSVESRLFADISSPSFLITFNMINDIFNGRTFNTDQYWAAVYYKFYVLGQNVTDINHVTDSDVIPALTWFIDRTLVFISGREHILGLISSPTAYSNYYNVNHDTTTDMSLVYPASQVAQTYWKNAGNFDPSLRGSWAGTIGVADTGLAQLAKAYGMTTEQFIHQNPTAAPNVQTALAAQQQSNNGLLYAAIAAGVLIIIGLS